MKAFAIILLLSLIFGASTAAFAYGVQFGYKLLGWPGVAGSLAFAAALALGSLAAFTD